MPGFTCEGGKNVPFDGPCPHCGATDEQRCRIAVQREAEERARKVVEQTDRKHADFLKTVREDKRRHGPVTTTLSN